MASDTIMLTFAVSNARLYYDNRFTGLLAGDLGIPANRWETGYVTVEMSTGASAIGSEWKAILFNAAGQINLGGTVPPITLDPSMLPAFRLERSEYGSGHVCRAAYRYFRVIPVPTPGAGEPVTFQLSLTRYLSGYFQLLQGGDSMCSLMLSVIPAADRMRPNDIRALTVSNSPLQGENVTHIQVQEGRQGSFNILDSKGVRIYGRSSMPVGILPLLENAKLFGKPTYPMSRYVRLEPVTVRTEPAPAKTVQPMQNVDPTPAVLTPAQKAAITRRRNRELARSRGQY